MTSGSGERLREMYIDERRSPKEIAEELGVHFSTVYRRLDRHGIERAPKMKFNTVGDGYEEARDPEGERVYIHRLIAVAEYGFDAVAGNDIHHKTGIPWDNRLSNVEPIGHGDHTGLHSRRSEYDRDEGGRFA